MDVPLLIVLNNRLFVKNIGKEAHEEAVVAKFLLRNEHQL